MLRFSGKYRFFDKNKRNLFKLISRNFDIIKTKKDIIKLIKEKRAFRVMIFWDALKRLFHSDLRKVLPFSKC